jgi:hypothetical protein
MNEISPEEKLLQAIFGQTLTEPENINEIE